MSKKLIVLGRRVAMETTTAEMLDPFHYDPKSTNNFFPARRRGRGWV